MPKESLRNKGYLNLTVTERIQLLENNLAVVEAEGLVSLARRLRHQLKMLKRDQVKGTERVRNW